jgi:hypothetical protein
MPSVSFDEKFWPFGGDGPWQGWFTHGLSLVPGQICGWVLGPKEPIDNFLLGGNTYLYLLCKF